MISSVNVTKSDFFFGFDHIDQDWSINVKTLIMLDKTFLNF